MTHTTTARKRQFCSNCLITTDDYSTRHMDDGRRFHRCTDTDACQARRTATQFGAKR